MNESRKLVSWNDLGGTFGAWGFLFGVITTLGVPIGWALATIVLPVAAVILLVQFRIWNREDQYRFVTRLTSTQGVGDELVDSIEAARDYILVSHARKETPSKLYSDALLRAHQRGVTIHRLVLWPRAEIQGDPTASWLSEQINAGVAEHRFASLRDPGFSWEIYVFDGSAAAIALPALDPLKEGRLPSVLVSTDARFVKSLETLYASYWIKADPCS